MDAPPWLVVGLGNPGPTYSHHRHNVGFRLIDHLASRWEIGAFSPQFGGQLADVRWAEKRIFLLKPMQFMNVSGQAVQRVKHFYQLPIEQIVVVHDDLDLSFGVVRVKQGGGTGGNNGLLSVSQAIGPAYNRIRVGIGRPSAGKSKVVSYVLGGFDKTERDALPCVLDRAADAIVCILTEGVQAAMNRYNGLAPIAVGA